MSTPFSNLRVDPWTGATSWRTMTPEIHTIEGFSELPGIYGFQLQDAANPATITVRENFTGSTPFTSVNTDPNPGEFRLGVAGYIKFNIADNGKEMLVEYEGAGSNLSIKNLQTLGSSGNVDGGSPDSVFGGIAPIDGGAP